MQELAPVVLFIALYVVLVVAALLTLVGSWLLIWRYQRGVEAAMHESGIAAPAAAAAPATPLAAPSSATLAPGTPAPAPPAPRADADALLERARSAPREAALGSLAAGLAFALILAVAFLVAVPEARTLPRFLFTVWVDCWPIVVAVAFTAPSFARAAAIGAVAYFIPFVVGVLVAMAIPEAPPESIEAAVMALQVTIPPSLLLRYWLIYAALPTVVLLLFLNPRTRAVSPLLLAFTTIVVSGCMAAWLAVFSAPGMELVVHAVEVTRLSVAWMLAGTLVMSIVACASLGWLALAWVRKAYLAKSISDRSLGLDAFWLFFAAIYSAEFAVQGPAWLVVGVLAFVACKLVFVGQRRLARRRSRVLAPRGLTFLRVFALGAKSNALFDALAKHWRRIGSMQLITGPDVAHSVVQPHQLLDFVSGRLASHFIADARTLEARMAQRDRAPDRDGWYRVNSFFCRADTWQAVLARLVGEGDVILMDLRSFSARNAGCVHEIRHLVRFVPLGRCVFVVDASTDVGDLRAVLREAASGLPDGAPNRSIDAGAIALHHVDSPGAALPRLLRTLCAAA
jgi:hypothetical protein